MRRKHWLLAAVLAAFVFIDVAPAAIAQEIFDLTPGATVAEERFDVAQTKRKRRTLMDLLFGDDEDEPEVIVQQPREETTTRQQPEPQVEAQLPPAKPAIEKAPGATRVAVFGDSLAADLGKALERFYAEDPNLAVIPLGVGSSGFVRDDFFDWNKTATEQIAADSFDLAVVIIGINDRQPLTVNGETCKPLTDCWKAEYTRRITDFLNQMRAANKPVIWVGLPPMSKSEYSTAMSQISAIQRLASFSGGAEFLDIYERFIGEDGKYSSQGPDLNGQIVRMRKDDGIHFSNAGSDKLAFYLSQTIKTFYNGGGLSIEVADPLLGTDAQAMVRLPFQGLGQIRMLEVAGAVISLSNQPTRAGDLLTAGTTVAASPAFDLEELMTAPVGRADAFGVGVDPAAEVENPEGR
jgi:uncharacterized protein